MDLTHIRFEGKLTIPRPVERSLPPAGSPWRVSRPVGQPVHPPVEGLAAMALEAAGLDPHAYRPGPLSRRIPACLRALRVESEQSACSRLEANGALISLALNTFLIGVSKFFRDEPVFSAIRTAVLPALAQRRGPIRVLSIGCSSGSELYSVAMLLAESGLLDRTSLLGVDCREEALSKAEAGLFHESALDGLDVWLRDRYMEPFEEGWRVARFLRRRTMWRLADATREIPPGPWDIVLCRNLFIYLQNRVVEAMFGKIVRELAPGGFLVVGKAERPSSALRLKSVGPCVYWNHAP